MINNLPRCNRSYVGMLERIEHQLHAVVHFRIVPEERTARKSLDAEIAKSSRAVKDVLRRRFGVGTALTDDDVMPVAVKLAAVVQRKSREARPTTHVAVVVAKNGRCAVGMASVSRKDQYNRRVGHDMAVTRALRSFLRNRFAFDLEIPADAADLRRKVAEAFEAAGKKA
jgi:hypothetical protein